MVEDNPYGLLGFEGEPTPAIRSLDDDRVVYLGSFSKTFAPGFRIGWVLAPHAVREKLVLAQESATLCPPVFSQFAIAAYLANHDWRGQIKVFREMYRERRDALLAGLADHMPAGTSLDRAGGRLLRLGRRCRRGWTRTPCCPARSPPGWPTSPAPPSTPTASAAGYMRLSYCFPTAGAARRGHPPARRGAAARGEHARHLRPGARGRDRALAQAVRGPRRQPGLSQQGARTRATTSRPRKT